MFGLMKNLIKETTAASSEAITLSELYAGCVLGFGFMPQKNISGKRIPVAEVNSYLFETDNFIVYKFESENADINLIVANEDDGPGNYLALSQRVEVRQFPNVFTDSVPDTWFALEEGDAIDVNDEVLGPLSGWLTPEYTLAVKTKGRFFEGDYRLRKAADRARLSRPFDYLLLVDEDNEYALEVEKYEDGTLSVLATVYRPSTDIGEIARAPKSGTTSVTSNSEAVTMPLSYAVEKIAHEPPKLPVMSKSEDELATSEAENIKDAAEAAPALPATTGPKLVIKEEVKPKKEEKVQAEDPAPEITVAQTISSPVAQNFVVPPLPVTQEPVVLTEAKAVAPVPVIADTVVSSTASVEPIAVSAALAEASIEALKAPAESQALVAETKAEPSPSLVTQEASLKAFAREISKTQDRTQPLPVSILPEAAPTARSKFGRIQHGGTVDTDDMLACDLVLAARLIDEAQRNQIAISELIRKVIDLPGRISDQVLIPFEIDSAEQAELARRYQVPAQDRDAVKQHILEELKRFAGEKK